MALRLMEKLPLLKNSAAMQKYATYLRSAEFKVDALLWIVLSFVMSALTGIIAWFILGYTLNVAENLQFGALIFIVMVDLLIGYPYLKAQQRIEQIEEALPDALRQMADTLKAGGTYEYALREIAMSEYGPLKKEMNEVLRKLEEGENFENALRTLTENVDSVLVKRTITIIIDSIKAGAGLANVLEKISEDVREQHRIDKERKTRTVMQAIFMFVSGAMVAPMIFGFVSTISNLLITASQGIADATVQLEAEEASEIIQLSIQGFILVESLATSVMISLMREGKLTKSIIYFPVLLFMAYLVYIAAKIVSTAIVS
ncbi:MAG: hypothetical protein COV47_04440 [Candidatus Diapherotrites archaeon CG11_big_fil_rev_8_21_14_0_20_37_9]|nr:MAG: hypothetical protein COV47_04440 [Candidatus Diapherotrites archaeon CG11_big_fil_rev_8_21_14_0_20_37_9]